MGDLFNGIYENIAGKDVFEFWTKCGMPSEVANGLIGKKRMMTIKIISHDVGNKSIWVANEGEGWNQYVFMAEGREVAFPLPGLGSATTCFKFSGPDCLEYTEKFEFGTLGTTNSKLTFSQKGIEYAVKSLDHGCEYTGWWTRLVEPNGTWVVTGPIHGDEDFPCFFEGMDLKSFLENPSYKYNLTICEEGFTSEVIFDDQCIETNANWGEETQNALDNNVTDMHVQTGPGSFKIVSKKDDGRVMETSISCCFNKMDLVFKDISSAKTLSCIMEKSVDFSGDYKIVSSSGMEEFRKAAGVKDLDAELLAGKSTTCTIIERDNSFFEKTIYNSGHQVAKIAAAYGEEVSTRYPHMGDQPFKVIVTKHGSTITIVSEGPSFTIKTTMKKADNFLIWEDEICGIGVKQTIILVDC